MKDKKYAVGDIVTRSQLEDIIVKDECVKDCLTCHNSFSEPCENGDILHCMEHDGEVVESDWLCEDYN